MTLALIIYIVVALLIVLLINVFLRKRKTSQSVRQPNPSHIKQNTDPSRFKASDLETSDESTEETDLKQTHSDETETESTYEQETTQNSETEETKQPAQGDSVMYRFGKGATRNKVLAAMLFGMFIAILNQTLLNVALPKINSDFNITASTGQWLMTGFMLVNGILIPVSAFLFDRFSYRKLYLFSLVIFTLGSLVCGIAMNFPVMMTGRVLQAAGAGILMPLGSNVIMTIFPPAKRGMAMGVMGVAMILAPAIGPTLSGYIVQNYHWNLMFYGMFFIGIVAIVVGYFGFKIYQHTSQPKADVPGIIFSTLGFGALLYGFSEAGNAGWGSNEIIVSFTIGVIFIILFILRELRMKMPMLNFEVLKFPTYALTTLINVIVMMSLYGGMLLLPIYLQDLRGFTAIDSGLLLLPGALVMGLLGPIAGKLYDMIGIKPLAIFGIAVMTYGTWELTHLTMDTPYSHIMGIYILRSFGMAFIMMPIMTAGMNALPARLISHGNALVNTLRQLAGSIGTAILVTVMTTQTTEHMNTFAQDLDKTNPAIQNQMKEMAMQYGGQEGAMKVIMTFLNKLATVEGVNDAFWIATLFSAIALFLSFFIQSKKKADAFAQEHDH
ncbi:DHA2 family efflux MFS transporter permease subunit [Staphylococcus simulans]|uniref:DHA2 family efflux MFS transporter permease subunit n=1 Tax=Staphylococcus simulans TaxID=1286 RepID=UPI002DB9DB09|nr:DHA2 family efflux MFS transporter permease subunit [Staphylococcus simulans]MEB6836131.1 DHA2 family efflux MFS transporter permease subunit [Staphylococcus simulans]